MSVVIKYPETVADHPREQRRQRTTWIYNARTTGLRQTMTSTTAILQRADTAASRDRNGRR